MELANPEIELITDPKSHQRCSFCDSVVNNRLRYGDMYKYKHIICHYFCVLMSSQLQQNGADNEGFFGFLLKDLQKELDRAKSVKCSFCKRAGATAQCNFKRARQKCQNTFHFTCGITHGTLHYFFGKFQSLCVTHRRPQKIPEEFIKDAATQCCICHEFIQDVNSDYSSLWASCCKKSFFHKDCVQHQAFVSGDYHFKCPLCNNHDEFKRAMLKCGIFLPIRDAEWEREPNAYSDLYREHNLCDIEPCLCPHGTKDCDTRRYNSGAWDIVRCSTCGSEGTHRPCSGLPLKGDVTWSCATCRQIMNKEKDLRSSTGQDTEDERKVIEPDTCSADLCSCNKGREHRGDRGMYRAVYCGDCEYSWIHTRCRNEAYGEVAKGEWICTGCQMSDNEDCEAPGTSNQEAVPRDPLAVEELTKKRGRKRKIKVALPNYPAPSSNSSQSTDAPMSSGSSSTPSTSGGFPSTGESSSTSVNQESSNQTDINVPKARRTRNSKNSLTTLPPTRRRSKTPNSSPSSESLLSSPKSSDVPLAKRVQSKATASSPSSKLTTVSSEQSTSSSSTDPFISSLMTSLSSKSLSSFLGLSQDKCPEGFVLDPKKIKEEYFRRVLDSYVSQYFKPENNNALYKKYIQSIVDGSNDSVLEDLLIETNLLIMDQTDMRSTLESINHNINEQDTSTQKRSTSMQDPATSKRPRLSTDGAAPDEIDIQMPTISSSSETLEQPMGPEPGTPPTTDNVESNKQDTAVDDDDVICLSDDEDDDIIMCEEEVKSVDQVKLKEEEEDVKVVDSKLNTNWVIPAFADVRLHVVKIVEETIPRVIGEPKCEKYVDIVEGSTEIVEDIKPSKYLKNKSKIVEDKVRTKKTEKLPVQTEVYRIIAAPTSDIAKLVRTTATEVSSKDTSILKTTISKWNNTLQGINSSTSTTKSDIVRTTPVPSLPKLSSEKTCASLLKDKDGAVIGIKYTHEASNTTKIQTINPSKTTQIQAKNAVILPPRSLPTVTSDVNKATPVVPAIPVTPHTSTSSRLQGNSVIPKTESSNVVTSAENKEHNIAQTKTQVTKTKPLWTFDPTQSAILKSSNDATPNNSSMNIASTKTMAPVCKTTSSSVTGQNKATTFQTQNNTSKNGSIATMAPVCKITSSNPTGQNKANTFQTQNNTSNNGSIATMAPVCKTTSSNATEQNKATTFQTQNNTGYNGSIATMALDSNGTTSLVNASTDQLVQYISSRNVLAAVKSRTGYVRNPPTRPLPTGQVKLSNTSFCVPPTLLSISDDDDFDVESPETVTPPPPPITTTNIPPPSSNDVIIDDDELVEVLSSGTVPSPSVKASSGIESSTPFITTISDDDDDLIILD